MRIYIDRNPLELGDRSDLDVDELRALAGVPEDRDLWRVADWRYSEKLGGPVTTDEKVRGRVYLGAGIGAPPRFRTAPRYINAS